MAVLGTAWETTVWAVMGSGVGVLEGSEEKRTGRRLDAAADACDTATS